VDTLVERCAGLDVHKDSVTACVRVPDGHGGRHAETRRFTTTTAGLVLLGAVHDLLVLLSARDCLASGVEHTLAVASTRSLAVPIMRGRSCS
jgi:hypothetical protein